MELVMYGVETFSAEVDERGIDFVAKTVERRYFDVQVKSVFKSDYIFFAKHSFDLRENLIGAVVVFKMGEEPNIHLIPSTAWLDPKGCLVSYDASETRESSEWGLRVNKKHAASLSAYLFDKMAPILFARPAVDA